MADKMSIYTRVVLKLAEKLIKIQQEARDSNAVPFMEERVTAREFRNRFSQMLPVERRRLIEQRGVDEVMKQLNPRE